MVGFMAEEGLFGGGEGVGLIFCDWFIICLDLVGNFDEPSKSEV